MTDNYDEIIAMALNILESRLKRPGEAFDSPATVRNFATLKLAELEHEMFAVLWLTSQHALIEYEEMFRGTLTQTSVYPREVVKSALRHNAGAAIFAHNHPSGMPAASRADEALTQQLKAARALIDVRVLDHIIVAGMEMLSFAEKGLI